MKYLVERRLRAGVDLHHVRPRHRSYWRRMSRDRVLLYGGVWAEGEGDTLIVQVPDPAALRGVLGGDPYVRESVVVDIRTRRLGEVLSWEPGPPPAGGAAEGGPVPVESGGGPLSAHEGRIARMMLEGMTNNQVAEQLGVSSRAVEQHITRIYRKLAIARRAQLAVALQGRMAA